MTASPDETLRATAELLIGLAANATPGPWDTFHGQRGVYAYTRNDEFDGTHIAVATMARGNKILAGMYPDCPVNATANGQYIAACDPSTITALARAYLELLSKEHGG